MNRFKIALLGIALGIAGTAAAHTDDYLDTVKAPHGGQLRATDSSHYELVIKQSGTGNRHDVLVYVTDHAGQAVDTKGATGTATILSGKKQTIALKPEGKNLLKGTGEFAVSPKLKAVVSIQLAGQKPEQARFTPFSTAGAMAGHKH